MKKLIFSVLILWFSYKSGNAQAVIKLDSVIQLGMFQPHYQGFMPVGVLSKRYGYSSTAGLNFGYKWQNNFYFFTGMSVLFGGKVKENNILSSLTVEGYVIDNEGNFTPPRFQQQGFIVPLKLGKLFPVAFAPNPNSGIYVETGIQFIQHKIGFNTPRNKVPALSKEYKRGYDRLSNGLGVIEAVGYRNLSNNGYFNFDIGLEFSQHLTQNRRLLNYDTGLRDNTQRLDILMGFHVGWLLPVWKKAKDKVYYYR